jgi:hypothetical protein
MKATAAIIIFFVFIYLVIFSLLTTKSYFFTLYNPIFDCCPIMYSSIKPAHSSSFEASLNDLKDLFGKPNCSLNHLKREIVSKIEVRILDETVETTECPLVYSGNGGFVMLVSSFHQYTD